MDKLLPLALHWVVATHIWKEGYANTTAMVTFMQDPSVMTQQISLLVDVLRQVQWRFITLTVYGKVVRV